MSCFCLFIFIAYIKSIIINLFYKDVAEYVLYIASVDQMWEHKSRAKTQDAQ